MSEIKHMPIAEFRAVGYIAEINRQLLHPLGLALEVSIDDESGEERISGVWDYREEAEGIYYDGDEEYMAELAVKAERIHRLWVERGPARVEALGCMVQPVARYDTTDARYQSAAVSPDPTAAEINARRTLEVTQADDELREVQTLLIAWKDDAGLRDDSDTAIVCDALLKKVGNARGKLGEWREEGE